MRLLGVAILVLALTAACSGGGDGAVESPTGSPATATPRPSAPPAPTATDSPAEQALEDYLADVAQGETGTTPEWYDAITDLELVGDTLRVSTTIAADVHGEQVARTVCGALLYTTVVPFEEVLVHDGDGVLASQCSR